MEALSYEPEQLTVPRYAPPPMALVRPRRSRGGVMLVVVGVLAAFCGVGAVVALLANAAMKHQTTTAATTPVQTTTQPPKPTVPGIGDRVRDGTFEFVVSRVNCGDRKIQAGFFARTAQGQFCVVDLSVKNIGDKTWAFSDGFQKALGPDGTEYGADNQAGVIVNEGLKGIWSSIDAGQKITGSIVFDIPKKSSITQLELHDSPLSNGAVVLIDD